MNRIALFIASLVAVAVVGFAGFVIFGGQDVPSPQAQKQPAETATEQSYSLKQVAEHNGSADCWTVIDNVVYDLTKFIGEHPGGDVILSVCGKDGTEMFKNKGVPADQAEELRTNNPSLSEEFHSPGARNQLKEYRIGILDTNPLEG